MGGWRQVNHTCRGSLTADDCHPGRFASVESELQLAVQHLRRSEEEHHKEIMRLESEVTRGVQERHKLMEKLEQNSVVEDAVRDLYLHMKVRALRVTHPGRVVGAGPARTIG